MQADTAEERRTEGQGYARPTAESYRILNGRIWELVQHNAARENSVAPIRVPALPLVRLDNLRQLHYVETAGAADERILLHTCKELAMVIAKTDKSVMNMDVPHNASVVHVLRLLLDRYQKITGAAFLDIRLEDEYAFNFSSMAAGYNPKKHYHFHAWTESKEKKFDMYAIQLEPLLNKFSGKEEKILRMLITLLHKHKIMYFISDTIEMITDWLDTRIRDKEFDDKEDHEAGFKAINELLEYTVGAINEEFDSLFSAEAEKAVTIDAFEKIVLKHKNWSGVTRQGLRKACINAIKAIRSNVSLMEYGYGQDQMEETLPVEQTFIFLWTWNDYIGQELKCYYQENFNNFGCPELATGVYNKVTDPFRKPIRSNFPSQLTTIVQSLIDII